MGSTIKTIATAVASVLAVTATSSAQAQDAGWEFNIAPYLWAAGIDADVTVGSHSASVEKDFSDIVEALDLGGGLMAGARLGRFVMVTQLDYLSLDSDELDDSPARGRLENESFFGMFALGARLGTLGTGTHVDLLVGVRDLSMDNTLTLDGIGKFERDKDFVDPIVMLRPSFRLSDRWRLNATFSYGEGGDSEHVWELQPHIEYRITDHWAVRFGYRKLHYQIISDNGLNNFHGQFHGAVLGFGGTFGGSPIRVKAPEPPPPPPPPPPAPVVQKSLPPPPSDTDDDGVNDTLDKCPSTPRGEKVDPVGCAYNVRINVLFETNSATLPAESHDELNRLVVALNSTPTLSAIVEGHTDSSGSDAHNLALSKRRAAAVVDYMVAQGISPSRLQSQGFGEAQPIADNTTAEGRAQNRRVVLRRPDAD